MISGKFYFIIALFASFAGCKADDQDVMARLKGMWKLVKYEAYDSAAGLWRDAPNRIGYTGYILYDGIGHMGVQLLPPGFRDAGNNKNTDSLDKEELGKALHLQLASFEYFGVCKIINEGHSIEHYRLSSNNPKEIGTTVKRYIEFRSDTLILTADELIGGRRSRLRWVRY